MSHLKQEFDAIARDVASLASEAQRLGEKASQISNRLEASLAALHEERKRHHMTEREQGHD